MNKIIKIKELSKSFGNKKVLDELNLEVEKNTSMVIIGGSGTGKSVLIKSILGLLKPDNGEIYYDGFLLNEKSRKEIDFHSRIGMLFQGAALFDSLQVWENITFGIEKSRSLKNSDWKDLAADKLKKVGLDPSVIYLYPSELSGGMQKRVALARAIATDPKVIFF